MSSQNTIIAFFICYGYSNRITWGYKDTPAYSYQSIEHTSEESRAGERLLRLMGVAGNPTYTSKMIPVMDELLQVPHWYFDGKAQDLYKYETKEENSVDYIRTCLKTF